MNTETLPERPAPLAKAMLCITLALLAGYGVTRWLNTTGRMTYVGYLQAHATPVTSPISGRIREILASEGNLLAPGQPAVVLSDERIESAVSKQQERVAALQAQLEQARAKAEIDLAWRLRDLDAELHATRLDSARFLQTLYDRRIELQAWQEYLSGDMVASRAAPDDFIGSLLQDHRLSEEGRIRALLKEEAARNGLEVAATQLKLCDERLRKLEQLRQELPRNVARAAGVDRLEARLAAATKELDRLQGESREVTLNASAHGTVGLYQKRAGDAVAPGETIVEILDEERRCLLVQVPSRGLAGLKAGTEVSLLFPSGEMRTGVIRGIPPQASRTTETDALIALQIDPSGKLWPDVPIGSAIEVTIER